MRRYFGTNATIYYDVFVTNFNNGPSVYAIGYALPFPGNTPINRKVWVQTVRNPLFNFALAATSTINFNGNNVATDSFDSSNTNYSNGGLYTSSKRKGNGDVVTDDGVINSVSIGNANIMGHVATGPSGTVSIGPNGSLGSVSWVTNGNTGIQSTSYVNATMNVQFPDVASPNTIYTVTTTGSPVTWWTLPPAGQSITINSSTVSFGQSYNTPGNNYFELSSTLSGKIYVGTNVNLVLWLTAGASFSGQDQITIAQGGSLAIYTAGSFSMAGNAAINNYNQNAANFSLFGLPTCTSISLSGNAAITGTVYAPEAALTMGGGGNTTYDFVGSAMAKTVTMSGKMNFHYDEALQKNNFSRGYIASNWQEVR